MKISFILPGYGIRPIGGFRIVYEYANFLADRGHTVTVIHAFIPFLPPPPAFPKVLRKAWRLVLQSHRQLFPPRLAWQDIHPAVSMVYLPWSFEASRIPEGDFVFATARETADFVHQLPRAKGHKGYLIQHWEAWGGVTDDEVARTWNLPLSKVVISGWLLDKARSLNLSDVSHIPNAIDHRRFRVLTPPEDRPLSVVALYHRAAWKGSADALAVFHRLHRLRPNVTMSFFGVSPRPRTLPSWIRYFENPPPESLVRDVYNGHSVYLGTSWTEGWALPPAEAMACGCAFVATDIGGFKDYAIHGETALLSPARDVDQLLANLLTVIDDDALRRRLQRQGTECIRSFTWARSGAALEEWIQDHVRPRTAQRSLTADGS